MDCKPGLPISAENIIKALPEGKQPVMKLSNKAEKEFKSLMKNLIDFLQLSFVPFLKYVLSGRNIPYYSIVFYYLLHH